MYLIVVLIITVVFFIPFLLKTQKFGFNVYSFFIVAVLVQVFLRNILMYFDLPNYDYVHRILLLNKPWEDFIFSALIFLLGSILTVVGYIFAYKYCSRYPSNLRAIVINPSCKSVKIWSCVLLTISLFSFISYFLVTYQEGGTISAYRSVSNDLDSYNAYGGLIEGVKLSFIVALLSLAYYMTSKRKVFLFLFLLSSFMYTFFAAYTSSRGSILIFFFGVFAIASFYNKLSNLKILIGSSIMIFIGVTMTFLRLNLADTLSTDEIVTNLSDLVGYIVVNNGGIDIPKFHHLIEHVQNETDYRLGGFLANILLLFIPRSIWSGKPVNIDTEFGHEVYGSLSYGSGAVPPGIYGEFFWDFWWAGFIFSAIMVGLILGFLDRFLHSNFDSVFVKVAYSLSILWAGLGLIGSGFVSYFIGLAMLVIPLYIVFHLSSYSYRLR